MTFKGCEIDQQDSYVHYQIDFGLVNKSAYSSAVNPNVSVFLNTVGLIGGQKRSENAIACNGYSIDTFVNALILGMATYSSAEMELKFVKKGEEVETKEYLNRHQEEIALRKKAAYDRILKIKEQEEGASSKKQKRMRKKEKANPNDDSEEETDSDQEGETGNETQEQAKDDERKSEIGLGDLEDEPSTNRRSLKWFKWFNDVGSKIPEQWQRRFGYLFSKYSNPRPGTIIEVLQKTYHEKD